jgi:hypothetical protein
MQDIGAPSHRAARQGNLLPAPESIAPAAEHLAGEAVPAGPVEGQVRPIAEQ